MKLATLSSFAALLAVTAILGACGGGGDDEAGSPTALQAKPETNTFAGPDTETCAAGAVATIFIFGGAAPYQISNPSPDYLVLDKTQVGERGGSFTVTTTGGCIDPGPIFIRDKLDNLVTVNVASTKGTAVPSP